MADPKIKFKRSAVAGKIPTAAQVPLGEIALNTNDGILYASKDVGAGTTVIAVNPFRVGTGTDSYNTFFTAGNVGIASTQPTGKLDVLGQVNIKGTSTTTPGTSHTYDPNYIDDSHGGSGTVTLSNSNKTFTTGAGFDGATATPVIPTSGKHYWEYHFGLAQILFTISPNQNQGTFANANGAANYGFRIISKAIVNGSETFVSAIATAWNTISSNSSKTIGVAYDADNGTLAMYFDGTLVHTISSVPTNTTYYIHTSVENANKPVTIAFDSSDWNQSAPSGFSSLNTAATTTTSNNHLNVSGITTTSVLKVGTGITASGGIVTATTFSGSGASLTNLPAANITGTLPSISGANLTNLNGSNISSGTIAAARVGALPASKITSGTFDAARIPTLNQDTTGTAALAEGLTGSPNITVSDVNVGGGLSVTGNSFFVGVVTFAAGTDGNIVLGDAATDNVVFNADVNSNIVPNTNNAYDLGSSSQKWRNLFISGNANIGGTLTYEDVTNIDSVGIITARKNIELPDSTGATVGRILFGAGDDLKIYHDGSQSYIGADDLRLVNNSISETYATFSNNGSVALYYDNSKKFETVTGGVTITGTATATLFSGSGASLTNLPAANLTGTLPAISGANLTNLDATDLASGTIPDARFPAALPAIDGSALTGITASGTGAIGGLTIKNQSGAVVGTAGSVSTIDFDGSAGVTVTATTGAAGIATVLISASTDLVTDTSPQLGGNLDLNGNNITGSGNIPAANLTGTLPAISVGGDLSIVDKIVHTGNTNTSIGFPSNNKVQFATSGSPRMTLDSSGRVLIGTTGAPAGTDAQYSRLVIRGNTQSASAVAYLSLGNGKTTSDTGTNENLGILTFNDNDNDAGEYARIIGASDGSNGTDDYPGKLIFSTTADGGSAPTERMRITSTGRLGLGTQNPVSTLEVVGDAKFSGAVSVGGVLTYEDVTNIDSVGLSTFRAGVNITGTATATLFSGSGASLTNLPAANLTGTLPAISGVNLTNLDASDLASGTVPDGRFPATLPAASGANLTNLPAANLTGTLPAISGANLTNLDASDLASGTVPDARFPATLPAASGANLTNLPAANITGTLPAISGANLTNLDASDLASGTIPDARFPATLPAISGANLTNVNATIAGISTTGTSTFNHVSVTGVATVSTAFYLPQYTTTARDAGTFNEGAMIYNTTTKKMEFYDGTNWNTLPGVTLGLGMGVF